MKPTWQTISFTLDDPKQFLVLRECLQYSIEHTFAGEASWLQPLFAQMDTMHEQLRAAFFTEQQKLKEAHAHYEQLKIAAGMTGDE